MQNQVQLNNDVGGMPFVRFERMPVEDAQASIAAGHYVAKDIDYAKITPPFSKDIFVTTVANWKEQLKQDAAQGRIPHEWLAKYDAHYQAWLTGQELPVDGTPIKGWGVCSPAQQETLIRMHILTVEQLAQLPHEGIIRVGMGAVDLKNKAEAWLKQLKKAGPNTLEIAALKKENDVLNVSIAGLESRVVELTRLIDQAGLLKQEPVAQQKRETITVDDLMAD
jgi:hypothetical protein